MRLFETFVRMLTHNLVPRAIFSIDCTIQIFVGALARRLAVHEIIDRQIRVARAKQIYIFRAEIGDFELIGSFTIVLEYSTNAHREKLQIS